MIETKVLRIENDEDVINQTSQDRAHFGWTITNVQVTHSENTKTYSSVWDQIGGNQSQTVETHVVDYATVTLQRDTVMPHYAELKELEKEYEECVAMKDSVQQRAERSANMGCLFYLFWPWSLLFKKKLEENDDRVAKDRESVEKRLDEIFNKAEALLR